MNIQGSPDPVVTLINKLSSGQDIRVNIQTETDNILIKDSKKSLIQSLEAQGNPLESNTPTFEKIFTLFLNRRSPNFPSQKQKYLIEKMRNVPIYTVVNGNNEIIMASPRSVKGDKSFAWLQEKYNEIFKWTHDEGPVTIALFFMNMENAESYMHEICRKEPKESEVLGLKIKSIGLDKFYHFNRTSPPKVQAKLIADLNEIDTVLNQCIGKFFCSINPKQRYSSTWFQGNPVYIIRLTQSNGKKLLSQYNFYTNSEKKIVFFSKNDALRAWKVFNTKHPEYNMGKNPNLEIYNFESLVNDLENNDTNDLVDLFLVPPYESYQTSKKILESNAISKYTGLELYTYHAKLKLKNFQRFYKGLVWLLTSDTLPSEENSW